MFHAYTSLFSGEPIWCNINGFRFACGQFMNNKFGMSYDIGGTEIRLIG